MDFPGLISKAFVGTFWFSARRRQPRHVSICPYIASFIHVDVSSDWTLDNFTDFLHTTFPNDFKLLIDTVAPILYQIVISLGSFPYHNDPVQHLTSNVLGAATAAFVRRDDHWLRMNVDLIDQDVHQSRLDAKYRRRLFQSLSNPGSPSSALPNDMSRDGDSDEDLIEALDFLSEHNSWRDIRNPKVSIRGTPIPPASNFPSSQSHILYNSIPRENLGYLLQFLLTSQLCTSTIGPECFAGCMQELETVSEHILESFYEGSKGGVEAGVKWVEFDCVIKEYTGSASSWHWKDI